MPAYIPPNKRGRGRGRPKGSKNKTKVMKKVGKRGAYKKTVKNQMVMRRAPMVETKQRVHSDIAIINGHPAGSADLVNPLNWRTLATDDAFTSIPLRSWTRMSQGFGEYQCIGNSIFSKYLNFKLQFRFPRNEQIVLPDPTGKSVMTYSALNRMIEQPTKVYLICGWVTESLNYPINNQPSPSLPAQSNATGLAIQNYIEQQLAPFFDDDEDKLQFRPKQTTNIKIEKYVKISPNLSNAIGTQATPQKSETTAFDGASRPSGGSGQATLIAYGPNGGASGQADVTSTATVAATGSIPDVYRSWSVKTNRKLPLTEGTAISEPNDNQNLYPNNSWIPFAVIYNPDYEAQNSNFVLNPDGSGQFLQVQQMEYRWNDAHYYTDS